MTEENGEDMEKKGPGPCAKPGALGVASKLNLMQYWHMRTTITLDDEVHEFASYYARARGLTLSAAIEELIRKAESAPAPPVQIEYSPNGLPRFSRTGHVLTSEMVKAAQEDDLEP
jgi:hypothetical protein